MARPEKISAVLFDFDGTTVDTEPLALEAFEIASRELGCEIPAFEFASLIGTNDELLGEILDRYGASYSDVELHEEMFRHFSPYTDDVLEPFEGLRELLEELHKREIKLGLVTSTAAFRIVCATNHMKLLSYYDVIMTGDIVAHKKPHPECYSRAINYLGVDPVETLVFEDSATGIKAAQAAGAYVCAFKGSGIVQDTSQADEQVANYNEFLASLR